MKRFSSGPDSLNNDIAPCVFADSSGFRIWVATMGGGLNCYDKRLNKFIYFRHDPGNPASISSDFFNWAPRSIAEDQDGKIWAGTKAGGLNRLDKKTGGISGFPTPIPTLSGWKFLTPIQKHSHPCAMIRITP